MMVRVDSCPHCPFTSDTALWSPRHAPWTPVSRGHWPGAAEGPGVGVVGPPGQTLQDHGPHPPPSPQTREHLAKAQRGLPGEGVSEVIQTLVEISQDGTSYSGDLLSTIDVLRNMTEIFRRAYYSPTPGDAQVGPGGRPREGTRRVMEGAWGAGGLAPCRALAPPPHGEL